MCKETNDAFRNKLWQDYMSVTTWEEQCLYYIDRINKVDVGLTVILIGTPIIAIVLSWFIETIPSIIAMAIVCILEITRRLFSSMRNPESKKEKVKKISIAMGEMKDSLRILWLGYEKTISKEKAIEQHTAITKKLPKLKNEMNALIPFLFWFEDKIIRKKADEKMESIYNIAK